jgi:hypothetical protein
VASHSLLPLLIGPEGTADGRLLLPALGRADQNQPNQQPYSSHSKRVSARWTRFIYFGLIVSHCIGHWQFGASPVGLVLLRYILYLLSPARALRLSAPGGGWKTVYIDLPSPTPVSCVASAHFFFFAGVQSLIASASASASALSALSKKL